jgi:hypothetical protein
LFPCTTETLVKKVIDNNDKAEVIIFGMEIPTSGSFSDFEKKMKTAEEALKETLK